jgi:UDP-glucose:(heptosyl)LPS alpha-1,3-glucosyltransferase
MRVGLVIRQFDPQRGGAERWTCELAERAIAAGYEVHVVAQSFAPAARALPVVPHVVPRTHSPYTFALAIDETLRELDLDLVHDMGFGWNFDILQPHFGAARAQFDRKLLSMPPWKRTVRRVAASLSPRAHQSERLHWRQYADHRRWVIAVSKLVARDLERTLGWPMERTRLIYNGVDLRRFAPTNRELYREAVRKRLKIGADELLVLFVAHNAALKGLPTLIRAVGQLRQANKPVRLVTIGGDDARKYARAARDHGAGDAIDCLGAIEDTAPFYAAADVFALPTWYDSCSLVVLEALASGVPVITSSHNGASELLTQGRDGFVIDDPGDWQQLTAHLTSLLDPTTRQQMGTAARQLAERQPMEANYRQVMALWQQIAGRMRRAA